ncbi:MAG: glycosyltransferase family 4 protein [Actinobacteria bacterium]|nr:glycosyltransferase family 4 protein [Actinomycetota bacterium]
MTSVGFLVDQLFSPAPGGIGTYVRELVPALSVRDPSLDIVLFHARFGGGAVHPEAWMRGYRTVEVAGTIRTLYPRWDLAARPALPAALRVLEVLHAPSPAAVPPTAGSQRLVVTVHDLAFEVVPASFSTRWRQVFRLGLRAAVRRADAVITPSRNTAEDLVTRTRIDPARVHVVPLAASLEQGAVDPERVLTRLRIPRPYVLSVGTLEPRKNLVALVRAYRRAAASGIPHALVLAGPLGWGYRPLLREIALAGPGEVVLTGPLETSELDAMYRGASAFAYPSLYEGFGLPVLEAMARGVPTVTSSASSLPEVAGDAAIAVDPHRVAEIAAAIQRVLGDEALAGRLAAAGRARAERYSWDETARLTLAVYDRVLGAK